jgi:hypothetical protein
MKPNPRHHFPPHLPRVNVRTFEEILKFFAVDDPASISEIGHIDHGFAPAKTTARSTKDVDVSRRRKTTYFQLDSLAQRLVWYQAEFRSRNRARSRVLFPLFQMECHFSEIQDIVARN